jgi:hypothetical protein
VKKKFSEARCILAGVAFKRDLEYSFSWMSTLCRREILAFRLLWGSQVLYAQRVSERVWIQATQHERRNVAEEMHRSSVSLKWIGSGRRFFRSEPLAPFFFRRQSFFAQAKLFFTMNKLSCCATFITQAAWLKLSLAPQYQVRVRTVTLCCITCAPLFVKTRRRHLQPRGKACLV